MDHIMGTGKVRGCCLLPPMGNGQSIPGSQPYALNFSFYSFLGQKPSLLPLQPIGVVALAWSRQERTHARGRGRGGTECVAEDLKMIIYINLRAHGVVAKNTIPPYFEAEINMIKKVIFLKEITINVANATKEQLHLEKQQRLRCWFVQLFLM